MDSSKKVRFRHSIGFNVGIFMAITLLIILGAKTGYDIMNAYQHSVENSIKIKQEETKRLGAELEAEFASAYQSGYTAQIFIQNVIDKIPAANRDRNYITDSLKGIFAENENVHGIGIYFEEEAYDNMDKKYAGKTSDNGRFATYIVRKNGQFEYDENDIQTEDEDWYNRPLKENKIMLLEPHIEEGIMMVTYCYPLTSDNSPIGVIVDKQDQKLKETEEKFQTISDAVDKTMEVVRLLNESSKGIEERNRDIVGVIDNLSAVSQQNAATSQEASSSVSTQVQSIADISKASENLAEIASQLQSEIVRFNIAHS